MAGNTLPEKVAQVYYTYGLFCSSYPFAAIFFSLSVMLMCCYPLLNVPLPGNIPSVVKLPMDSATCNSNDGATKQDCLHNCKAGCGVINKDAIVNETLKLPHMWVKDKPLVYIQQFIIKTGVSPWNSNLKVWDAFRGPLHEVFRLLETVRNHEDPETKSSLSSFCFQVDGVKRKDKPNMEHVLPEYSCLLLSPANLWNTNIQKFSFDNNIINTIYNHQYQKGKVSVAEMAFGMQLRDTGIKRYPLRARSRTIQYALTIFYQQFDDGFINSLNAKLRNMYPLHQDIPYTHADEVTLIYYPGEFNYRELIPLTVTFFGIFLYVYFSVRKIECIKSKFGLAACAMFTVAGSLSVSLGISFHFGFTLSLQGKEIFPYLLIIVGLENVLVLTKSVTSTDSRLDVKIRLAQGLSKEGWSITQNLLTEMTILTVSFFTFVPFIQEFSIFMIISLLSDYFIQMVFFATVLGIDVRRMECFQDHNNKLQLKEYFNSYSVMNWRYNRKYSDENESPQRMVRTKSHPRLNGLSQPTDVVAQRNSSPKHADKVPKRIRLVNLWARTRFFQRAFMVWMLVWISLIVYNSGIIEYLVISTEKPALNDEAPVENKLDANTAKPTLYDYFNQSHDNSLTLSPLLEVTNAYTSPATNDTIYLKHSPHSRPWFRLSPYYWSSIVSQYNESVSGRYVVVLPPTLLSHRVAPELAIGLRNPEERDPQPLRWQALVAALDPIDLPEFEMDSKVCHQCGKSTSDLPIYPTTPMEILLLAILCTISVVVIAYMMVVLYRCICSRNYAEWRASWTEKEEYIKMISKQPGVQLVMEAVPLVVTGHSQEVECLVTDGEKIVSTCLQGVIKVWDSHNGEMLLKIDRATYYKYQKELLEKSVAVNGGLNEIAEVSKTSESSRKSNESVHRLRKGLSNHLTELKFRSLNSNDLDLQLAPEENTKYEFAKSYRNLYCSEQRNTAEFECYEAKNHNRLDNRTKLKIDIASDNETENVFINNNKSRLRNSGRSLDSSNSLISDVDIEHTAQENSRNTAKKESPIWCMDFYNDLIILGCADGKLEFWDAISGKLVCIWWCGKGDNNSHGVSHVRAVCGGRRVCAATLSGHLALVRLDAYNVNAGVHVDWQFSTAHRRTHKRTGSAGSIHTHQKQDAPRERRNYFTYEYDQSDCEEVQCTRLAYCRPHQQPITELHCEGGRILTGGQDHVLKVFSSMDLSPLFTLHGHCGPITTCFIDHATPTIGGSGSQDGLLCVWDLHTGACLYSIQAHDGAVTSLAYTASYVVSAGADERLCVWDRFQGHMLNSFHIGLSYMSKMLPITHTLLLMGDRNGLTVYDLSSGDVIRRVLLGQNDGCIYVRQLLPLKDAIVCDYANQLRIVRFPLVSKISDMNMKSD